MVQYSAQRSGKSDRGTKKISACLHQVQQQYTCDTKICCRLCVGCSAPFTGDTAVDWNGASGDIETPHVLSSLFSRSVSLPFSVASSQNCVTQPDRWTGGGFPAPSACAHFTLGNLRSSLSRQKSANYSCDFLRNLMTRAATNKIKDNPASVTQVLVSDCW